VRDQYYADRRGHGLTWVDALNMLGPLPRVVWRDDPAEFLAAGTEAR